MEHLDAGLSAIAFWGFLAIVVAAGIWSEVRKRDAQHETFRRLIDSGRDINPKELDALVAMTKGGSSDMDKDLKVGGLIMLAIAPGLALMGWVMDMAFGNILMPLLGVALLVLCIALGLLAASKAIENKTQ